MTPRPRAATLGTAILGPVRPVAAGCSVGGVVRMALVAMVAALSVLVVATPAAAHASLSSTSPTDREVVASAPEDVTFTFNEPVTATSGALRVFDADGQRVDTAEQVQVEPEVVAVGLGDLAPGGYVATYLVTSQDGHVVRGAITFSVGSGAGLDDDTVAALFGSGSSGVVAWLLRLATVVAAAASLVALGALLPLLRANPDAGTNRDPDAPTNRDPDAPTNRDPDAPTNRDPDGSAEVSGGSAGSTIPATALTTALATATSTDQPVAAVEQAVARRTVRLAAWWGIAAALATIPVQAMAASGLGAGALTSPSVVAETITSSVGLSSLTLVAGLVGLMATTWGPVRAFAAGGSAVLVVVSFVLAGHTRSVAPTWVLQVADMVHVTAAGLWLGGLVVVMATLRRASTQPSGGGPRDPAVAGDDAATGLARVVADFSRRALWAVGAVAVAGSVMTWVLARQPRALVSTEWGWTLLVKVALVAVVVVVAAYNRWRLVPAITSVDGTAATARRQLSTTMRVEAGVLAVVLVATGVLVGLRPAASEAGITGAFDTVVAANDDLSVNLVVDPNRAGSNQVHVYLLDQTGRPTDQVDELTIELLHVDEDLGPLVRTAAPAGPGHWLVTGNDLAIPGTWQVTTVIRLDRFSELRVPIEVVVNAS